MSDPAAGRPARSVSGERPRKPAPRKRSGRRRAREYAVQGLYQWLLAGGGVRDIAAHLSSDGEFVQADSELFHRLLAGTIGAAPALDEIISAHIDRPLDELAPVEHAVLLLASHELQSHPETPWRVIVNEAIDLTRDFGGTDGHRFVNGVLEKVAMALRPDEAWQANSN
jgi:N utilization substance protein B